MMEKKYETKVFCKFFFSEIQNVHNIYERHTNCGTHSVQFGSFNGATVLREALILGLCYLRRNHCRSDKCQRMLQLEMLTTWKHSTLKARKEITGFVCRNHCRRRRRLMSFYTKHLHCLFFFISFGIVLHSMWILFRIFWFVSVAETFLFAYCHSSVFNILFCVLHISAEAPIDSV